MSGVVTVLPPRERFSPVSAGAIGLLVHRLARVAGGTVVGRPVAAPFGEVAFRPAPLGLGLAGHMRYARGVVRVLGPLRPQLVEVHNKPDLAHYLADRFPHVVLYLNNDPQGMRRARTAAERTALLGRLARVVVSSEYLRGRVLDGVSGEVTTLFNSLDVPERVAKVRERLILFVGRVVRDKGADSFVEACAAVLPQLPGWRAEVVGADRFCPDSPRTPFVDAVAARAAAAGVHMAGYQTHAVVMERMGRAAIAVVPSRWPEPFGLAALEAMAHGAALVCSSKGGLPEVAGPCARYADPDEPDALATAILALARDDAARTAQVAAAFARAKGFDTAVAARRLTEIRAAVLGC